MKRLAFVMPKLSNHEKNAFDICVPTREEYKLGFGNADVIVHYVCDCGKKYILELSNCLNNGHVCNHCGLEFFLDINASYSHFSL